MSIDKLVSVFEVRGRISERYLEELEQEEPDEIALESFSIELRELWALEDGGCTHVSQGQLDALLRRECTARQLLARGVGSVGQCGR